MLERNTGKLTRFALSPAAFILATSLIISQLVTARAGGGSEGSGLIRMAGLIEDPAGNPPKEVKVIDLQTQNKVPRDQNGKFEIETGRQPTLVLEKSEVRLQTSLTQIPLTARAVWTVLVADFIKQNLTVETLEVVEVAKPPTTDRPSQTPTPPKPTPNIYPSLTPGPLKPSPAKPTPIDTPNPKPTAAPAPSCKGDLNCDRSITFADIEAFVLARDAPQAYSITYPHCDRNLADINNDGLINDADANLLTDLIDRSCP